MRGVIAASLLTLLSGVAYSEDAGDFLKCPEAPAVKESLVDLEPGWEIVRDEGKRGVHLVSISVYDGHPSGMAVLVPDAVSTKNRKRVSLWKLSSAPQEGYWISCNYSNTQLMLARRVPGSAETCEVGETLSSNGRLLSIDVVRCR